MCIKNIMFWSFKQVYISNIIGQNFLQFTYI